MTILTEPVEAQVKKNAPGGKQTPVTRLGPASPCPQPEGRYAPAFFKPPSASTPLLAPPDEGQLVFSRHLPLSRALLFYTILQSSQAGPGWPRSVNC